MLLQSAATLLDVRASRILQFQQQRNSPLTLHFSALACRGASMLRGGLQGLPATPLAQSPMQIMFSMTNGQLCCEVLKSEESLSSM